MIDSDDPFLVTSQLGIKSVLRALVVQKTLVHLRLEQHGQAIITTLLDVDSEQDRVVIDAAASPAFNERLIRAPKLHFDARVDQIRVQFHTGQATQCLFDQRAAFSLPSPNALRRLQRRDHFRIDIPVSTPLFCELPLKSGKNIVLPVKDISAGGVALLDRNEEFTQTEGAVLKQCTFQLDDIGTVALNLRVRRISNQVLGDWSLTRVVACEFVYPAQGDAIMIQNYIGRLERALNARRRGFD